MRELPVRYAERPEPPVRRFGERALLLFAATFAAVLLAVGHLLDLI